VVSFEAVLGAVDCEIYGFCRLHGGEDSNLQGPPQPRPASETAAENRSLLACGPAIGQED
jgi:hypothetical protein